jgi:hypothetical protein
MVPALAPAFREGVNVLFPERYMFEYRDIVPSERAIRRIIQ